MSFGSGMRPPWGKLFERGNRTGTDFSVSPVHEIADDIDPAGGSPDPPTSLEPLVTGVTTEYPTSELITDDVGDVVTAGV